MSKATEFTRKCMLKEFKLKSKDKFVPEISGILNRSKQSRNSQSKICRVYVVRRQLAQHIIQQ